MKHYNVVFIIAYVILRIIAILVTICDSEHPDLSNWAIIYFLLALIDAVIIFLIWRNKKITQSVRIDHEGKNHQISEGNSN